MRLSTRNLLNTIRAGWKDEIRGLILIFYVVILYLMAYNNWQVNRFGIFLTIFIALPFLIIFVFRVLGRLGDEK